MCVSVHSDLPLGIIFNRLVLAVRYVTTMVPTVQKSAGLESPVR